MFNDGWCCGACTYVNDANAKQCAMCDLPDPGPSYAIPIDLKNLAYISTQIKYPLVRTVDDLKRLGTLLERTTKEFSISDTFRPSMVAGAMMAGVFPMSINIWEVAVPAYKLHQQRCVMEPPGVVHKSTRKRAAHYSISVNSCFDRACDMVNRLHENCWLCPGLRRSLKFIQANPDMFPQIRIMSWELWAKKTAGDGEQQEPEQALAAVEIGFIMGSTYCSMTGAYDRDYPGAGSVQLACTGGWLVREKIALWDFGMAMDYKEAMGARKIPRVEWLQTCAKLGAIPVSPNLLDTLLVRVPCSTLMPFTSNIDKSKKKTQKDEDAN